VANRQVAQKVKDFAKEALTVKSAALCSPSRDERVFGQAKSELKMLCKKKV
jgi:hypothetical protein